MFVGLISFLNILHKKRISVANRDTHAFAGLQLPTGLIFLFLTSVALVTTEVHAQSESTQPTELSINDWRNGFLATYSYEIGSDVLVDEVLQSWRIEATYTGEARLVNAWMTGYRGAISFFTEENNTFVITNEDKRFQPLLVEGDHLRFSIRGRGDSYDANDFTFRLVNTESEQVVSAGVFDSSFVRVNDWYRSNGRGGFIATYQCEVSAGAVNDFVVEFNYSGSGTLRQAWAQSYAGRTEYGLFGRDGGIALRNVDGGRTPTLNVGDSVRIAIQFRGAGYSASDFDVNCMTLAEWENQAPIADAGDPQTVLVGRAVNLNGSGSTDPNGDSLTFDWIIVDRPEGSQSSLSSTTDLNPSFIADKVGTYRVRLAVNDGYVDSEPAEVTISTYNSKPIADAGPDQSAFTQVMVNLNGSSSSDNDGDPLEYQWSFFSSPVGSAAVIDEPSSVLSSFTPDLPGQYILSLVVNDGYEDSDADDVVVNVEMPNTQPVASAGADQSASLGTTVVLDAIASSDVDGDILTYSWSVLSKPGLSNANVEPVDEQISTLLVDQPGEYLVQLIVSDGQLASEPDTMLISTVNSAPIAVLSGDETITVGDAVEIDGSGSYDPDGDVVMYDWALLSRPDSSLSELSGTTLPSSSIIPDVAGTYVVQLIVSDAQIDSEPTTLTIIAVVAETIPSTENIDTSVESGSSVQIALLGADEDGDQITYQLVGQPEYGSVSVSGGIASYVPDEEIIGIDSFSYTASDGTNTSNTSEVIVRINPQREPLDQADIETGIIVGAGEAYVFLPAGRVVENTPITVTNQRTGQTIELIFSEELGGYYGELGAVGGDTVTVDALGQINESVTTSIDVLIDENQTLRSAGPPLPSLRVQPVPFIPKHEMQWIENPDRQIYEVTLVPSNESGFLGTELNAAALYVGIGEDPSVNSANAVQYLNPIYVSEGSSLHIKSSWDGEGENGIASLMHVDIGVLQDGTLGSSIIQNQSFSIDDGSHDLQWDSDGVPTESGLELSSGDGEMIGWRFPNVSLSGDIAGAWMSLTPLNGVTDISSDLNLFGSTGLESLGSLFEEDRRADQFLFNDQDTFTETSTSEFVSSDLAFSIDDLLSSGYQSLDFSFASNEATRFGSFESIGANQDGLPRIDIITVSQPSAKSSGEGIRSAKRFSFSDFFTVTYRYIQQLQNNATQHDGLLANPESLVSPLPQQTVTVSEDGEILVQSQVGSGGLQRKLSLSPKHIPAPPTTIVHGELADNLIVDNSGGLNYQIPVPLPEAPGGLTPDLSLDYNSNGGLVASGVLGVGWGLSGITAITHCSRNFAKDGKKTKTALGGGTDEQYCINGKRLLPYSDGAANEYRAENDAFTRYFAKGGSNVTNVGDAGESTFVPDYWEMQDRNGFKYLFGSNPVSGSENAKIGLVTSDSTVTDHVFLWTLNSVSNPLNQFYSVHYFDDAADKEAESTHHVVQTLKYGTVFGSHITVQFDYFDQHAIYGGKGYKQKFYREGFEFSSQRYLKTISVRRGEKLLYRYYFDYLIDPEMIQWRLARARYCTTSACYPEKRFTWSERGNALPLNLTASPGKTRNNFHGSVLSSFSDATTKNVENVIGDFNGDGRADMAAMIRKKSENYAPSDQFSVCLFNTDSRSTGDFDCNLMTLVEPDAGNENALERIYKPLVGDFNGDGLSDLLFPEDIASEEWKVCYAGSSFLSTGDGGLEERFRFICDDVNYAEGSNRQFENFYKWNRVGDFNGDGISDVFNAKQTTFCFGQQNGEFHCSKSTFRRENGKVVQSFDYKHSRASIIADFTGDGASDIIVPYKDEGAVVCSASELRRRVIWNFECDYIKGISDVIPGDFNGDGLADLIKPSTSKRGAGRWYVYYSDGKTFLPPAVRNGYPIRIALKNIEIGDMNGDGLSDVVGNTNEGWFINYSSPNGFVYTSVENNSVTRDQSYTTGKKISLADYDGDGRSDIALARNLRNTLACPESRRVQVGTFLGFPLREFTIIGCLAAKRQIEVHYAAQWSRPHLQSVSRFQDKTDEVGELVARIEYDYSPRSHFIRSGYPERLSSGGQYVVSETRRPSSIVSSSGTNVSELTTYSFSDMRLNVEGLGSYGFSSRRDTDLTRDRRTESKFLTDNYYQAGLLKSISNELRKSSASSWQVAERTDYEYESILNGNGQTSHYLRSSKPFTIRPSGRTTKTFDYDNPDLQLSETVEDMQEYDAYNNLKITKKTITDIGSSNKWTRTSTNTYENRTTQSKWHLGFLKSATTDHQTTVPNSQGAIPAPVIKKSQFEYDPNTGQLSAEIVEPGAIRSGGNTVGERFREYMRTEYGYDTLSGKVNSKIVRAYDHQGALKSRRLSTIIEYLESTNSGENQWVRRDTVTNDLLHKTITEVNLDHGGTVYTKDSNGLVTTADYNGFGRILKAISPDGSYTEYSPVSKVLSGDIHAPSGAYSLTSSVVKGPQGQIVQPAASVYVDRNGRTLRTVAEAIVAGKKIYQDMVYDIRGRKTVDTEPFFVADIASRKANKYQYDGSSDRLDNISHIDGTKTEFFYDGLASTTVRAGREHTEKRYANGDIIEQTQGGYNGPATDKVTLRHFYDGAGRRVETVDPKGMRWLKSYSRRDFVVREFNPDTGSSRLSYNGFGELTASFDSAGKATLMAYDVLGRVALRRTGEGTEKYIYDTASHDRNTVADGLVHTIEYKDMNGVLIHKQMYAYDQFSRVKKTIEEQSIDGSFDSIVDYEYDFASRLKSTTMPGHSGLVRHYDRGFLEKVTRGDGTLVWKIEDKQAVDSYGNATGAKLGNGVTSTFKWDGPGRQLSDVLHMNGGLSVAHHHYTYHPEHAELETRTDHFFNVVEAVDYDVLGRLNSLSVDYAGTSDQWAFTYDRIGNLKGRPDRPELSGVEFQYGTGKPNGYGIHAITKAGSREFHYDCAGNLVGDGQRNVEWTEFDKPESITKGDKRTQFSYGIGDSRILRVDTDENTEVSRSTRYVSGGSDISLEVVKSNTGGSTENRYHLNIGGQTLVVDTVFVGSPNASEQRRYLHHDRLGSVIAQTDQNGSVLARYSYDIWGGRRTLNSFDPVFESARTALDQSRGFTGHEMLDDVGLVHMNGRIYDPQFGRFMSADPIIQRTANVQHYNRYSYIQNNPLGGVDPSGYTAVHWQRANDEYHRQFDKQRNIQIAAVVVTIASAGAASHSIGAAMAVSATGSAMITAYSGGSGSEILIAAARAAISAGIAGDVGALAESGNWTVHHTALVHAGTQAAVAKASGANDRGVIAAMLGAGLAEYTPVFEATETDVAFAMIVGGTSSYVIDGSGASFIDGALTAGFVRLYNKNSYKYGKKIRSGRQAERAEESRQRKLGRNIVDGKVSAKYDGDGYIRGREFDIIAVDKTGKYHLTEVKFRDPKRVKLPGKLGRIQRAVEAANAANVPRQFQFDTNASEFTLSGKNIPGGEITLSPGDYVITWVVVRPSGSATSFDISEFSLSDLN